MAGPDPQYVPTPQHWKFEVHIEGEQSAQFIFDAYDKNDWPTLKKVRGPYLAHIMRQGGHWVYQKGNDKLLSPKLDPEDKCPHPAPPQTGEWKFDSGKSVLVTIVPIARSEMPQHLHIIVDSKLADLAVGLSAAGNVMRTAFMDPSINYSICSASQIRVLPGDHKMHCLLWIKSTKGKSSDAASPPPVEEAHAGAHMDTDHTGLNTPLIVPKRLLIDVAVLCHDDNAEVAASKLCESGNSRVCVAIQPTSGPSPSKVTIRSALSITKGLFQFLHSGTPPPHEIHEYFSEIGQEGFDDLKHLELQHTATLIGKYPGDVDQYGVPLALGGVETAPAPTLIKDKVVADGKFCQLLFTSPHYATTVADNHESMVLEMATAVTASPQKLKLFIFIVHPDEANVVVCATGVVQAVCAHAMCHKSVDVVTFWDVSRDGALQIADLEHIKACKRGTVVQLRGTAKTRAMVSAKELAIAACTLKDSADLIYNTEVVIVAAMESQEWEKFDISIEGRCKIVNLPMSSGLQEYKEEDPDVQNVELLSGFATSATLTTNLPPKPNQKQSIRDNPPSSATCSTDRSVIRLEGDGAEEVPPQEAVDGVSDKVMVDSAAPVAAEAAWKGCLEILVSAQKSVRAALARLASESTSFKTRSGSHILKITAAAPVFSCPATKESASDLRRLHENIARKCQESGIRPTAESTDAVLSRSPDGGRIIVPASTIGAILDRGVPDPENFAILVGEEGMQSEYTPAGDRDGDPVYRSESVWGSRTLFREGESWYHSGFMGDFYKMYKTDDLDVNPRRPPKQGKWVRCDDVGAPPAEVDFPIRHVIKVGGEVGSQSDGISLGDVGGIKHSGDDLNPRIRERSVQRTEADRIRAEAAEVAKERVRVETERSPVWVEAQEVLADKEFRAELSHILEKARLKTHGSPAHGSPAHARTEAGMWRLEMMVTRMLEVVRCRLDLEEEAEKTAFIKAFWKRKHHPVWCVALAALIGKEYETGLSRTLKVAQLVVFVEEICPWATLDVDTLAMMDLMLPMRVESLSSIGLLSTTVNHARSLMPTLRSPPRIAKVEIFEVLEAKAENLEQVKAEKAMWAAALAALIAKKYGVDATQLLHLAEATDARDAKKTGAPAVRATLDGEQLAELERMMEEFAKQQAAQRGAALEQIERAEAGQNRPIRTEGANSRARGEAERLAAKKAGVLKQDEAERAREMMAAFVNRMSEERTKMLAAHREVQEYAEALEQTVKEWFTKSPDVGGNGDEDASGLRQ